MLPEWPSKKEAILPAKKYERIIVKVILLGDKAVGKTSLRNRYCNQKLKQKYQETIGADFVSKHLERDGLQYTIQIWDIASGQSIEQVREILYKGAKGIVVIFDTTRRESLERTRQWLLKAYQQELDAHFVLVGNKIDLRDSSNEKHISTAEGQAFAERLSKEINKEIPFYEVSAITGKNIDQMFSYLFNTIL